MTRKRMIVTHYKFVEIYGYDYINNIAIQYY
jgi:hypothetical protein